MFLFHVCPCTNGCRCHFIESNSSVRTHVGPMNSEMGYFLRARASRVKTAPFSPAIVARLVGSAL